jgi:hypothetical protein
MQTDDLDEVDFSLLHLINYIRSFGVADCQLQRLISERLEIAFAIADQFDDDLGDGFAESPSKSTH